MVLLQTFVIVKQEVLGFKFSRPKTKVALVLVPLRSHLFTVVALKRTSPSLDLRPHPPDQQLNLDQAYVISRVMITIHYVC